MAFYYVKNTGTALNNDNGRTTVKRTKLWNSAPGDSYGDLAAALGASTTPTTGDFILVSDASQEVFPDDYDVVIPDGVHLISVSDSNQDQYAAATDFQFGAEDLFHAAPLFSHVDPDTRLMMGLGWQYRDTTPNVTEGEAQFFWHDLLLMADGLNDEHFYIAGQYSSTILLHNLKFTATLGSLTQRITIRYGGMVHVIGGSMSGTRSPFLFSSRGGQLRCYGVDMSACADGANVVAFPAAIDGSLFAHFYRCKFPTNWAISNEDAAAHYAVVIESCDSEYQHEYHNRTGVASFVTSRHHADDPVLSDGSSKGSYELAGSAFCSSTDPLFQSHPFMPRWLMAENTDAATNGKVRIKFASDSTLDTASLWVYVCYPTSADPVLWTSVRHQISPIDVGTPLSEQSSKWTGAGTTNQYYLDVTMPSPGDGLVACMVGSTESSPVVIYVSPVIEFVP